MVCAMAGIGKVRDCNCAAVMVVAARVSYYVVVCLAETGSVVLHITLMKRTFSLFNTVRLL